MLCKIGWSSQASLRTLEGDLNERREQAINMLILIIHIHMLICKGPVFQAERTVSTKTMRQKCAWCMSLEQFKVKNLTALSGSCSSSFPRAISFSLFSITQIGSYILFCNLHFPLMINHEHSFMSLHLRSISLFIKTEYSFYC